MKAIILAAGGGSRLAPIGITTPKVLIPILNTPLLHHHINALSELIDEAIVVIGPNYFGQQIKNYIASQHWPVTVNTVVQDKPLGTAHAYQAAASIIPKGERILFQNGDDLYSPQDLKKLTEHSYASLGQPVSDPEKWGILQANAQANLQQIVEKPQEYIGNLANTGAFVATTDVFELYHQISPSSRGEYEITDTITLLCQKYEVKAVEVEDYWLPIGYPWHILQAHQSLVASITHSNSPAIIMGENVKLGHNVELHGTVVIGNNVTIGDNSKIDSSTIFNNVRIGSHVHISHSIIGHNVNIGSNFTTLDIQPNQTVHSNIKDQNVDTGLNKFGVVIGDNVTIHNNVTTHPGVKIWPNISIKDESEIKEDVVS